MADQEQDPQPQPQPFTADDLALLAGLTAACAEVDDEDSKIDGLLKRARRKGWLIVHADGSPPTLEELAALIATLAPRWAVSVQDGRALSDLLGAWHALAGAHGNLNAPDESGISTRDRIGAGR